jgi:hypothetical protein
VAVGFDLVSDPTLPPGGRLTATWRAITIAAWIGVFTAYLAVWKASVELGLSTWWLGARSDPQPLVIQLVPFYVAAFFGILASYNVRRLPWFGLVGAGALLAIAVPDVGRSVGLAVVEVTIAGAVAMVALASFTGVYPAPAEQLDR